MLLCALAQIRQVFDSAGISSILLMNPATRRSVGNVSGKVVPPSLFMIVAKTLFRSAARNRGTPGEILARLTAEIGRDNCMFVTLFCSSLNRLEGIRPAPGPGLQVIRDLNLAMEEILTNIISYGYTDIENTKFRCV
jgi:Stage II sporulation protein E (SpoIIE)